jgi:hypothetical protein
VAVSNTVDLRMFLPTDHKWSEGATTMIDLAAPPADAMEKIQNDPCLAQLASQRHLQNVLIGLYGAQGVREKTDPPLWKAIRDNLPTDVDLTSVDMPVLDVSAFAIRQLVTQMANTASGASVKCCLRLLVRWIVRLTFAPVRAAQTAQRCEKVRISNQVAWLLNLVGPQIAKEKAEKKDKENLTESMNRRLRVTPTLRSFYSTKGTKTCRMRLHKANAREAAAIRRLALDAALPSDAPPL